MNAISLRAMVNHATEVLNNQHVTEETTLRCLAIGQIASAVYLGQIATTLAEMLQMAKASEAEFNMGVSDA